MTVLVTSVLLGFTRFGLAVGMRFFAPGDSVLGFVGAGSRFGDRDGLLRGACVVVVVGEEGEAVGLCVEGGGRELCKRDYRGWKGRKGREGRDSRDKSRYSKRLRLGIICHWAPSK